MFLAEINEDKICIGIKSVNTFINDGNHVEIAEYTEWYFYRKWVDNKWSEETYEPPVPEPQENITGRLLRENLELKLALAEQAEHNALENLELKLAIAELAERSV